MDRQCQALSKGRLVRQLADQATGIWYQSGYLNSGRGSKFWGWQVRCCSVRRAGGMALNEHCEDGDGLQEGLEVEKEHKVLAGMKVQA